MSPAALNPRSDTTETSTRPARGDGQDRGRATRLNIAIGCALASTNRSRSESADRQTFTGAHGDRTGWAQRRAVGELRGLGQTLHVREHKPDRAAVWISGGAAQRGLATSVTERGRYQIRRGCVLGQRVRRFSPPRRTHATGATRLPTTATATCREEVAQWDAVTELGLSHAHDYEGLCSDVLTTNGGVRRAREPRRWRRPRRR